MLVYILTVCRPEWCLTVKITFFVQFFLTDQFLRRNFSQIWREASSLVLIGRGGSVLIFFELKGFALGFWAWDFVYKHGIQKIIFWRSIHLVGLQVMEKFWGISQLGYRAFKKFLGFKKGLAFIFVVKLWLFEIAFFKYRSRKWRCY